MSDKAKEALEAAAKLKAEGKKEDEESSIKAGEDKEVTLSADEEEATKLGWRPEEDYEGDEWISAEEFMGRKPLFDAISKEKKRYKKLNEKMDLLVSEFNTQLKGISDKEIAMLRQAKLDAVELGDSEKYTELQKAEDSIDFKPIESPVNTDLEEWKETNTWYDSDEALTIYADGLGSRIKSEIPNISNADLFDKVAEGVKEAFPAKFSNQKRNRPSPVAGEYTATPPSKGNKSSNKKGYTDLPESAQIVYRQLVKSERNPSGPLTAEKFIEGYAKKGGSFIERGN